LRLRLALGLALLLAACGRSDRTVVAPPAAPVFPVTMAWSWHPIGGLAVIEGEVGEATDLVLEGRSIRERRYAEPGPVRWEFYRPPAGESAVLRTEDGRVLARFEFADPEPAPRPRVAQTSGQSRPEPPAPRPAPPVPPPSTRAETRLQTTPVAPLTGRQPFALPSTTEAPGRQPAPPGPPATTRAETRVQTSPVAPLPGRRSFALPSSTEAPPGPAAAAPPPATTRVETRLEHTPLSPLPGRRSFALPSTNEGAPVRSVPELPPARARVETWHESSPVAPLPGRRSFALPSTTEAPPGPAAVAPPPATTRVETRLEHTPLSPLPGRRSFALPSTTEAPPGPAAPAPSPATTRVETRLEHAPLSPLPGRRSFALPSTNEGAPARPLPELPPARARAEAWLPNTPVAPLPGRKPFELPDPNAAVPVRPAPELPPAKAHAEASLRATPILPIPSRKPLSLPGAGEASTFPARPSGPTPTLTETLPPRPGSPVFAPGGTLPAVLWPGQGEALNLTRGPGGRRRLVLSFDGGSSAEVAAEVLDILKARGVRTTLFLTGAFIQRYPALVKRMAAEGHELGNHTMNHPHFAPGMKRDPKWTRERVQKELLEADAALLRVTGRPMDPFWRAPFGEHTAEIRRWAEELGYRHVGWSEGADTLDWATPHERRLYRTGEAIVARLQQRLDRDGDGIIVLMHLGSARPANDRPTDGLGAFMDRARQQGWSFVPVGAYLHDLGKPDWDSRQRLALLHGTAQGR